MFTVLFLQNYMRTIFQTGPLIDDISYVCCSLIFILISVYINKYFTGVLSQIISMCHSCFHAIDLINCTSFKGTIKHEWIQFETNQLLASVELRHMYCI